MLPTATLEKPPEPEVRGLASQLMPLSGMKIGQKLVLIVAAFACFGYAILVAVQVHTFSGDSYELLSRKNIRVTKLLADQVAGGVRWMKPRSIQRSLDVLTVDRELMISNVRVVDVHGQVLSAYDSPHVEHHDLEEGLRQAISESYSSQTTTKKSDGHLLVFTPVRAGKDRIRVGHLAIAWSLEAVNRRVFQLLIHQAVIGTVTAVLLIFIVIYLMHRVASRPLAAIAETTSRLATGDVLVEVPYTERRDEIGDLARSLGVFKKNLTIIDRFNNEQVEQSAQLAKALEKEREYGALQREFVAMASHEIRTPLTIIDGAAQRIERRLDRMTEDQVREKARKIRNGVARMIDLIESVLSSSSLDAGKFKIQVEPCDLGRIVKTVCDRQQEISASHEIHTDLDALPEEIVGDAHLLEQVFGNLLSNAVKYAPEDPRIDVVGGIRNREAFVSVSDHGVGIPEAEQEKIFDRYFRASTATGIAGTGIGLNLVAQTVALHGGRVELESAPGEGTRFTVVLPIRKLNTTGTDVVSESTERRETA